MSQSRPPRRRARLIVQEIQKDPTARTIRWSNFIILINSNVSATGREKQTLMTDFATCIRDTFSDIETVFGFLDIIDANGDAVEDPDEREAGLESIEEDVKMSYNIELGPKYGKIHSHILLEIKHKSRLQVNIPRIRDHMRHTCPWIANPWITVKVLGGSPKEAFQIYQYMTDKDKDQRGMDPEFRAALSIWENNANT